MSDSRRWWRICGWWWWYWHGSWRRWHFDNGDAENSVQQRLSIQNHKAIGDKDEDGDDDDDDDEEEEEEDICNADPAHKKLVAGSYTWNGGWI